MKRTLGYGLMWVSLIFLIQACALGQALDVATVQDLGQVEKSRVYPNSYDAVWAATIRSLATAGVSIQSQEKSSGIISTGYFVEREASGPFVSGSRVKASILVEQLSQSSTQVTVTPTFQSRIGDAEWRQSQRPRNQLNLEKGFFDAVQKAILEQPEPRATTPPVIQPTVSEPPASSRPLVPTTEMILRAQAQLKAQGLYSGSPDGSMGPKTREALRRFQTARRLQVTGDLDPATLEALGVR